MACFGVFCYAPAAQSAFAIPPTIDSRPHITPYSLPSCGSVCETALSIIVCLSASEMDGAQAQSSRQTSNIETIAVSKDFFIEYLFHSNILIFYAPDSALSSFGKRMLHAAMSLLFMRSFMARASFLWYR